MSDPGRTARVSEVRLFLSGPPGAALDRFEAALERAGSFVLTRGPWSLAAAPRTPSAGGTEAPASGETSDRAIAGGHSPGPGTVPIGGAQLALVPVQVDPSVLRAWLTWVPVPGVASDPIQVAVDAFNESERDASRVRQSAIEARERTRDVESAWLEQAANIRRALETSGMPTEVISGRLEAMRLRWLRTHRGATAVTEDEPPPV